MGGLEVEIVSENEWMEEKSCIWFQNGYPTYDSYWNQRYHWKLKFANRMETGCTQHCSILHRKSCPLLSKESWIKNNQGEKIVGSFSLPVMSTMPNLHPFWLATTPYNLTTMSGFRYGSRIQADMLFAVIELLWREIMMLIQARMKKASFPCHGWTLMLAVPLRSDMFVGDSGEKDSEFCKTFV